MVDQDLVTVDVPPGIFVGVVGAAVILKVLTTRKLWDMDGRTGAPLWYREHL